MRLENLHVCCPTKSDLFPEPIFLRPTTSWHTRSAASIVEQSLAFTTTLLRIGSTKSLRSACVFKQKPDYHRIHLLIIHRFFLIFRSVQVNSPVHHNSDWSFLRIEQTVPKYSSNRTPSLFLCHTVDTHSSKATGCQTRLMIPHQTGIMHQHRQVYLAIQQYMAPPCAD